MPYMFCMGLIKATTSCQQDRVIQELTRRSGERVSELVRRLITAEAERVLGHKWLARKPEAPVNQGGVPEWLVRERVEKIEKQRAYQLWRVARAKAAMAGDLVEMSRLDTVEPPRP